MNLATGEDPLGLCLLEGEDPLGEEPFGEEPLGGLLPLGRMLAVGRVLVTEASSAEGSGTATCRHSQSQYKLPCRLGESDAVTVNGNDHISNAMVVMAHSFTCRAKLLSSFQLAAINVPNSHLLMQNMRA